MKKCEIWAADYSRQAAAAPPPSANVLFLLLAGVVLILGIFTFDFPVCNFVFQNAHEFRMKMFKVKVCPCQDFCYLCKIPLAHPQTHTQTVEVLQDSEVGVSLHRPSTTPSSHSCWYKENLVLLTGSKQSCSSINQVDLQMCGALGHFSFILMLEEEYYGLHNIRAPL